MKLMFGATISIILLAIYAGLVWLGINFIWCADTPDCVQGTSFTDRMTSSLSLIGGLVSALVISELSITKPGEMPLGRILDKNINISERSKNLSKYVTGAYLIIWLLTGLAAYFIGYLGSDPGVLPALSNLGQAWLGLAIGAGYAYLGINQK